MLTNEFKGQHPATPWIDIVGMRHVLVHGYYTASPLFIWDTYKNDLDVLRHQIESYISELQNHRDRYIDTKEWTDVPVPMTLSEKVLF